MDKNSPPRLVTRVKSLARDLFGRLPPSFRAGVRYRRIKRKFKAAQWWNAERIAGWQRERLGKLLDFAYRTVPGYRLLWDDAGVKPADVRRPEDLAILPFTTKELLRDNERDFVSRAIPARAMHYESTSGSTGIPFGFFHTALNDAKEDAFLHLAMEEQGWRNRDLVAVLRGGFNGTRERFWKLDRLSRSLFLSSYFLDSESYQSYRDLVTRFSPLHLRAYPSSALILSDLVIEHGDAGRLDFRSIILGSENVLDWQKERIRQAFPRARLFSFYGQTEQVVLAVQCLGSEKYHVVPFYGYAELVGADGAEVAEGETGEIVGTSFWSFATPFIRYRTADNAVKGPAGCEKCGRAFPLLDRLDGRALEQLVTRTGRQVPLTRVASIHSHLFDHIGQFRFYQDEPGRVRLKIVAKTSYTQEDEREFLHALGAKLGDDIDVEIVHVREIPRGARGKHSFLDQKLHINHG